MRGRGDLREVPRAQRSSLVKTLLDSAKAFADRREAMVQAYLFGSYTLREIAVISAHITLRPVVVFDEGDNSEPSRGRMGTAKHFHCRITRLDPVLPLRSARRL